MFKFLFLLLLIIWSTGELALISVNPETNHFIDATGAAHVFRGINAVYKIFPWIPNIDEEVSWSHLNSFTQKDIEDLKSWGTNIVRLGVMWPGVNPHQNVYNTTYLDQIENLVNKLAQNDIYTMLDCHQDLISRYYCGEGAPDYLIQQLTEGVRFPRPIPYEIHNDQDGYPYLDQCLNHPFWHSYFSDKVGLAFQKMYTKDSHLYLEFGKFWKMVAERFKSNPAVIGYDLINEPWFGDLYSDPFLIWGGKAEETQISEFFTHLHDQIRKVDQNHIIFYEPVMINVFSTGFKKGPGGDSFNSKQSLSYHIYCPLVSDSGAPKSDLVCEFWDQMFMEVRQTDIKKLKTAGVLSEYGALDESEASLREIERINRIADYNFQSTIYWSFKHFEDITTANRDGSENLYYKNGTLQEAKVKALSRTYAKRIAGNPVRMRFDSDTSQFDLTFQVNSQLNSRKTEIFANRDFYYPNGISIEANVEGDFEETTNSVFFIHSHELKDLTNVEINLKKK